MKNIYVFLAVFLVLVIIACVGSSNNGTYADLTVKEFKTKMKDADVIILDVRTPAEIAEGKIKGAIGIDYKAADFQEKIANLDKDKTYLIYCASGRRSSESCKIMHKKGFLNLYNLNGGYKTWMKE